MIGLEHLHSVFSVSRLKQHHENSHSNLKLLYLSIKQPRITRSIHENCRFSVNPPKVFRVPRVQRVPRWWSSLGISHSSAQSIGYPHRCFCGKVQVIEVSKYNSLILMTCFRKIHQNGSAHVNIYIYIYIFAPSNSVLRTTQELCHQNFCVYPWLPQRYIPGSAQPFKDRCCHLSWWFFVWINRPQGHH